MCKIDPIISPWIFYAIEVLEELQSIATIGAVLSVIFVFACLYDKVDIDSPNDFDELFGVKRDIEQIKKANEAINRKIKKAVVVLLAFVAVSIFIPSEQTMYKMLIANYVTPNNIEYIHETVKGDMNDALNAIADKIIETQKEVNNP